MRLNMKHLFYRIVFGVFLCSSLIACGRDNYISFIEKQINNELDNMQSYESVVIIPSSGCTGCINSAEQFFLNNVSDTSYFYIFTNYFSKKSLRLRLGESNLMKKNVYLDSCDVFYSDKYNESIYPVKVYINNGRVNTVTRF